MTAVYVSEDSAGRASALGTGRKDSDVEEAERMFRETVEEKGHMFRAEGSCSTI